MSALEDCLIVSSRPLNWLEGRSLAPNR